MAQQERIEDMERALGELPMIDTHTHLVGGHLAAKGLHDVMLYHMMISDLYAAGCPSGTRLTEFPDWPTDAEAQARIEEAIPYLHHVRNTAIMWCLRMILADLYEWNDVITVDNWRRLDAMIRERAADSAWQQSLLDRVNIRRSVTEWARRGKGEDDFRMDYALEWAFFTRCQWGEFDTALYELERCWGREPESPTRIGAGSRPPTQRTIETVDDVRAAMDHYVDSIPCERLVAMATQLSTDIHYRQVSEAEMARALTRRAEAGSEERDIYASYINEAFLDTLEKRRISIPFQFSLGAEALPKETSSRLSQHTMAEIAEIIARHPNLHFQCFLGSQHANQTMCTLARELPNLSLIGCWWHNFFPTTIERVFAERLEMVPINKQIGFFSDAYTLEWTYGKAILVRKVLARVLADKVEQGYYGRDEAISIARSLVFESPQSLLGIHVA